MSIVAWLWDFGDGLSSIEQNPTHAYQRPGTYSITLTVWSGGEYVNVDFEATPLSGAFPTIVDFTDKSTLGGCCGGESYSLTKNSYITITAPADRTKENVVLRLATTAAEGIGWSEFEGDHMVDPPTPESVLNFIDENDIPRMFVIDADKLTYEEDTYNRVSDITPSALDKRDDEDDSGYEIPWEMWCRAETVDQASAHKRMSVSVSHLYVAPQDYGNRSKTGYDANGFRSAQEISLDAYLDDEQATPAATVTDIPDDGDAVFAGVDARARRVQLVFRGTAGEIRIVGRQHEMIIDQAPATRAESSSDESGYDLELSSNKSVHLSRGHLLLNRATGATLAGAAVGATGPDGISDSSFVVAAPLNLLNAAIATDFTVMLWSGTSPGAGYTAYGAAIGSFQLYYRRAGSGLAANLTLTSGAYFDVRIYRAQISLGAIAAYYVDVRSGGRRYLPV